MIDFSYSEEQKSIRELAKKATEQFINPIVDKDEMDGCFRPEVIHEFGKLGLTGIPTPEEFGGAGLGYLEYVMAIEEIATSGIAYPISIGVSGLPQFIINKFGNAVQKKKYIPRLARGECIGAFALTEPGSGSDAGSLRTKAVEDGADFIINGTKLYITQGNVSETFVVFARTGEQGNKGISAFILEKGMKGVRTGKIEHKMGANISPTCEMLFENVRVPKENLIGKLGDGFKIAMTALDSGRITIGATAVGLARSALNYCIQYAGERKQFGERIRDFQGIQFMLADMHALLEASRLLVHKAAFQKDQNENFTLAASTAKFFATDACMKITTDAVQIMGGNGYMKEFPLERYMREAKVLQIVEGTNQIQRFVVGRML